MKYKSFLIKYGEIGVKGKNRYMFEDALMKQIRIALKEVEGSSLYQKNLEEYMWIPTEIMTTRTL